MEPEPTVNPISTACVGDCKSHAADVPNWTQMTVVGGCDKAVATNVFQVAVAGVGGLATFVGGGHGVVAVASQYGHAIAGNGGVAISGSGLSEAKGCAIAYAKGGMAVAGSCGVAVTAGGYASAEAHGIGIGWFSNTTAAKVEAGPGGVAIGDTSCFVKVGAGGVLIAMTAPRNAPAKTPPTKICRVGECGGEGEGEGEIMENQWYEIKEKIMENGSIVFLFTSALPPTKWEPHKSPCPVPPKP